MQIEVGQIVEGKVTGITNFGVFVDLGDGKSGLVHISEIAQNYVSDVREYVKENDTVKMKVLSVSDDGKISLSIKRAEEPKEGRRFEHKSYQRPKEEPFDPTKSPAAVWTPKKSESASFEDMMAKFKSSSDEIFSDLKKKNPDSRRSKRSYAK